MTDTDLESQIRDALKGRSTWEQRQTVFYEMRHQGLRRAHKPFPGAADLHFPLADTQIEKLKPFYFAQLYATETFAALICKRPGQDSALTTAAAQWFDYKLRTKSNFQTESLIAIDRMLGSGAAALKIYWDAKRKQLRFSAPQVTHIILPTWTEDIQEADWLVHVQQLSEAQYLADPRYNQDTEFVGSIKGTGQNTTAESNTGLKQQTERREGVTCGSTDEMIVLWEIYQLDHSTGTWTIKTRSPLAFDKPVREDFGLPYEHGKLPFVLCMAEVKEQGCFSSRGVTEILAPFETSACKLWNEKHDYMSFVNRPLYHTDKDIPNVGNIQLRPGQILPFGLSVVEQPSPPLSFDDEMNRIRETAEYRLALPDFGVLQDKGGHRTATEVSQVAGQSSTVSDIRTRIFRLMLADIYAQAWALLVQYDNADLAFTVSDAVEQLDPAALHEDYEVLPNGSDQSWNRGAQLQRAMQRMQAFAQNPYINQAELVKSVLEVDDPRLVKRLFVEPQTQAATQAEEQAMEIATMLLGFPCPVQAQDDDAVHIQTLSGFVQRRLQTGEPITPEMARLLLQHGGAHAQALEQKKNPQAKQIEQQAAPVIAALGHIAQQPDQPPQNVVPGPGASPAALPAPGAPPAAGAQPPPTPDKLMNGLAALMKSGAKITNADINTVLAQAGLPPLPGPANAPAAPPEPVVAPTQPQGVAA